MHDLTGFQRDLLYVIAGMDQPHGLAVKTELEQYYDDEVHHGRLYPNLDTLAAKGLVEKGQADRRTNEYALTRRGRREIEARREWEREYYDHVHDLEAGLEVAD
jgi:DNA-binding PadR family transcriptional regulator